LAAALQSQARKATLPVSVEAEGVDRYPQEVEAAVYFCVLEALQNVQKYAGAQTAVVRVAVDGADLRFDVEDDGAGFDIELTPRGSGLRNMADRLDALGGGCEIDSAPGRGTRLRGRLPLIATAAV
jgi:signal transduction histidine kinase